MTTDTTATLIQNTTRAHYEKYRDMAARAHVTLKDSTSFGTPDQLRSLYAKDQHLNNIPLARFDALYPWMRRVAGGPQSMAENCCMYKHLLIYEIIGAVPNFTD